MSAIVNVLNMFNILLKGRKVKIGDLEKELGVNERQVRRYKSELGQYFEIESSTGPEGGYLLKNYSSFYKNMLTKEEMAKLKFLIYSISPEISYEFKEIINKLNFIIGNENEKIGDGFEILVQYSIPSYNIENMYKITTEIETAISECNEILIKYVNNGGQSSDRRVRPYKIINYKGENYLYGECLLKNEVRNFKLVRIKEYIRTSYKFERSKEIEESIKEAINNFGIYGGDKIEVELEIRPPMANTIKEKIWGNNQEVEEFENGSIVYKAEMTDSPEIVSWILSMGDAVSIIAPISLREIVVEKLEKMLRKI